MQIKMSEDTSVEHMKQIIMQHHSRVWPSDWHRWKNVVQAHVELYNTFVDRIGKNPQFIPPCEGQGIVMGGGGRTNFTCAYVCIRRIRELGCTLPIELWHFGSPEIDDDMKRLLEPYDVEYRDALEVARQYPARILGGWELKPYSIIFSRFKEVIFIDSDNAPTINVAELLLNPDYLRTGSLFWPDFPSWMFRPEQWAAVGRTTPPTGLPPVHPDRFGDVEGCAINWMCDPPIESGQMLMNKEKCAGPLALVAWMCNHSDYFFKWFHGDKDCFYHAWNSLNVPYGIVRFWPRFVKNTIYQFAPNGSRVIFHHRTKDKWSVVGTNEASGYPEEKRCFEILNELKVNWNGVVQGDVPPKPVLYNESPETEQFFRERSGWYMYGLFPRAGTPASANEGRDIYLETNGTITKGFSRNECYWDIKKTGYQEVITFYGLNWNPVCHLTQSGDDGFWRGQYVKYERFPCIMSKKPKPVQVYQRPEMKVTEPLTFVVACSQLFLAQFRVLYKSIRKFYPQTLIQLRTWGEMDWDKIPKDDHQLLITPFPVYDQAMARERANLVLDALKFSERVVNLGADMELFAPINDALEMLLVNNVVLIPHICQPQPEDGCMYANHDMGRNGLVNSDFQAVHNNPRSWDIYHWLAKTLEHHCYVDPSHGMLNEQKWLSMLPALFDGVLMFRNKTINVAPYNQNLYHLRKEEGEWVTDEGPLALMHYTGIDIDKMGMGSMYVNRVIGADILEFYDDYRRRVQAER